jgi:hypothetical protein
VYLPTEADRLLKVVLFRESSGKFYLLFKRVCRIWATRGLLDCIVGTHLLGSIMKTATKENFTNGKPFKIYTKSERCYGYYQSGSGLEIENHQ